MQCKMICFVLVLAIATGSQSFTLGQLQTKGSSPDACEANRDVLFLCLSCGLLLGAKQQDCCNNDELRDTCFDIMSNELLDMSANGSGYELEGTLSDFAPPPPGDIRRSEAREDRDIDKRYGYVMSRLPWRKPQQDWRSSRDQTKRGDVQPQSLNTVDKRYGYVFRLPYRVKLDDKASRDIKRGMIQQGFGYTKLPWNRSTLFGKHRVVYTHAFGGK